MITRLRQAQDSWIAKLIFALTALSFMSLFGISGYLNRAASNPAVIRVNNNKISLAEFNMQIEEQIRTARKLFGDNIEITDEMRTAMASELVQKDLSELITKEIASKQHIFVGNNLIGNIIRSQPQFYNDKQQFDMYLFKNFLSATNLTEQKYVETLRNDLIRSFLITNPVSDINVSKTLAQLTANADSLRKIFKYIEIDPATTKIDRTITVLELSFEDIAKHVKISDDDIEEYYKNNIDRFETPETRQILQMIFADEETARKASKELSNGADFYATAQKFAEQTKEDTDLGFVSKDNLVEEMADDIFDAKIGSIVGPTQSDLGWHIMKVQNIKSGSKVDSQVARRQIIEALSIEKAYDDAYEITKEIDDKIGSGSSLEDISKELGVPLKTIKGLSGEDTESPYTETAYSYNLGEISQATESDHGFVFVRIDNVVDSHQLDLAASTPKIKKLWEENEKSAIAQEIINDVMTDLENGDKLDEIARRYHLRVNTTPALTRSQNFADLKQSQMIELFNDKSNTGKQFSVSDKTIIAVVDSDASPRELSEQDMDIINRRLSLDLRQEASSQLINSYGNKYDVRVKYRQLGLED